MKTAEDDCGFGAGCCYQASQIERLEGVITALRERLAQLAQPEHHDPIGDAQDKLIAEQAAQQEPVLQNIEQYRLQMASICTAAIGYWKESDGIHPDYDTLALRDVAKLYAKYDELYKAQPEQRTWVGLTDEEIAHIADSEWEEAFVRMIEAKLKEKNT